MMKKCFKKLSAAFGAVAIAGSALLGLSPPSANASTSIVPPSASISFHQAASPTQPFAKPDACINPATIPVMEGQNTRDQDDLDFTIPGTDIVLGGDGKHGYPQISVPGVYEGNNPLPVPRGTRPLPTGTATGPNGEKYGFYAIVPYYLPNGHFNDTVFTSDDTVVVDLAHPDKILFTLKGISQASGAYDAQSGRMVILGNTQSGDRALWQSAPISNNAAWGNTLQQLGTFSGAMNGDRESQIVALPKGGFLVVGAGTDRTYHCTLPIEAVTAATPQGLLTATPTAIVPPQNLPGVYGPTITDIQEIKGKEVVTIRMSTFGWIHYDPHTYKATFTITPANSGMSAQAKRPANRPSYTEKL